MAREVTNPVTGLIEYIPTDVRRDLGEVVVELGRRLPAILRRQMDVAEDTGVHPKDSLQAARFIRECAKDFDKVAIQELGGKSVFSVDLNSIMERMTTDMLSQIMRALEERGPQAGPVLLSTTPESAATLPEVSSS